MTRKTISLGLILIGAALMIGSFFVRSAPPVLDPTVGSDGKSVRLSAELDEEALGNGVRIVPRKLLEDSRCPSGLFCIQAGTVRISTDFTDAAGARTQEFKLGQTVHTRDFDVTFSYVDPSIKKAGEEIPLVVYRFSFDVRKH